MFVQIYRNTCIRLVFFFSRIYFLDTTDSANVISPSFVRRNNQCVPVYRATHGIGLSIKIYFKYRLCWSGLLLGVLCSAAIRKPILAVWAPRHSRLLRRPTAGGTGRPVFVNRIRFIIQSTKSCCLSEIETDAHTPRRARDFKPCPVAIVTIDKIMSDNKCYPIIRIVDIVFKTIQNYRAA